MSAIRPNVSLPFFKKDAAVVLTSFKVMYSFFDRHPGFEKQYWNKRNIHLAALNAVSGYPPVSVFMRKPEDRFLSYFRDKFRKEPMRCLGAAGRSLKPLQNCQKLWIAAQGKDNHTLKAQYEYLLRAEPDEVIDWLEITRDLDVHTIPQVVALKASWRGFHIPLRPKHFYILGPPMELQLAGRKLGVSFAHKVNSTDEIGEIKLSEYGEFRLREIYHGDFAMIDRLERQTLERRRGAATGHASGVAG